MLGNLTDFKDHRTVLIMQQFLAFVRSFCFSEFASFCLRNNSFFNLNYYKESCKQRCYLNPSTQNSIDKTSDIKLQIKLLNSL